MEFRALKPGRAIKLCLLACAGSLAVSSGAGAETLADALALAYRSNPTLQAARADLRVADEAYVQARGGFGPQVQVGVTGSYTHLDGHIFGPFESNAGGATLTVDQPLFTGGRLSAQVERSLRDIDAERQRLRGVEASVLFTVIQAYSDVRRDQGALAIRQEALEVYRRQVDEINARVRAGELTRTDIAQVQAQFEAELASVNNARAQLELSRAAYVAAVGQNPGSLAPEPVLPGLPATVDEAFKIADEANPSLLQAIHLRESTSALVAQAKGAYLPSVSLRASYGYDGVLKPFDSKDFDATFTAGLTVSQPLFAAGQRGSAVRQAQAREEASRSNVDGARRSVVQTVANAWNGMMVSRTNVDTATRALTAARLTFEGMQIEYRADLRSTYEVLNAEERLASAQLFLLSAQHDQFVSSARLLAVMGRLEAASVLDVPAYDPTAHFKEVRNKGLLPTDYIGILLDGLALQRGASTGPMDQPAAPASQPVVKPGAAPRADAPLTGALPVGDREAAGR